MPDRKMTVIHQFDDSSLESSVINNMQDHPEFASRITLIALRDRIAQTRRDLIEHVFSQNMAHHIGLTEIGEHDAILWTPDPTTEDWFRRLKEEEDTGKRILLRVVDLNTGIVSNATEVIIIPTQQLTAKIYAALGIK